MSQSNDKLLAWISGVIESLLTRPEMWGSVHAVEMQFLLLSDLRDKAKGKIWADGSLPWSDFLSSKGINRNALRGPSGYPQAAETHEELVKLCREFLASIE